MPTVVELRAMAKARGLKSSGLRKAELLTLLGMSEDEEGGDSTIRSAIYGTSASAAAAAVSMPTASDLSSQLAALHVLPPPSPSPPSDDIERQMKKQKKQKKTSSKKKSKKERTDADDVQPLSPDALRAFNLLIESEAPTSSSMKKTHKKVPTDSTKVEEEGQEQEQEQQQQQDQKRSTKKKKAKSSSSSSSTKKKKQKQPKQDEEKSLPDTFDVFESLKDWSRVAPVRRSDGTYTLNGKAIPTSLAESVLQNPNAQALRGGEFEQQMLTVAAALANINGSIVGSIAGAKQSVTLVGSVVGCLQGIVKKLDRQSHMAALQIEHINNVLESINDQDVSANVVETMATPKIRPLAKARNLGDCEYCSAHGPIYARTLQKLSKEEPWRVITFPHRDSQLTEVCFDVVELWMRIRDVVRRVYPDFSEASFLEHADRWHTLLSKATGPLATALTSIANPAAAEGLMHERTFSMEHIMYILNWYVGYTELQKEIKGGHTTAKKKRELLELGKHMFGAQAAHIQMATTLEASGSGLPTRSSAPEDVPELQTHWMRAVAMLKSVIRWPFQTLHAGLKWIWHHPTLVKILVFLGDCLRMSICAVTVVAFLKASGMAYSSTLVTSYLASYVYHNFLTKALSVAYRLTQGYQIRALSGIAAWSFELFTGLAGWFGAGSFMSAACGGVGSFIQAMPMYFGSTVGMAAGMGGLSLGTVAMAIKVPVLAPLLLGSVLTGITNWGAQVSFANGVWSCMHDMMNNLKLLFDGNMYLDTLAGLKDPTLVAECKVLSTAPLISWTDPSTFSKIILMSMSALCPLMAGWAGKGTMALCHQSMRLLEKVVTVKFLIGTIFGTLIDIFIAARLMQDGLGWSTFDTLDQTLPTFVKERSCIFSLLGHDATLKSLQNLGGTQKAQPPSQQPSQQQQQPTATAYDPWASPRSEPIASAASSSASAAASPVIMPNVTTAGTLGDWKTQQEAALAEQQRQAKILATGKRDDPCMADWVSMLACMAAGKG